MGLDIRWPIGVMFSLVGALLLVYGVATSDDVEMYRHSLDININIIWGIVLLLFGGGMLLGAVRGRKNPPKP
jgi:hypothetical protein